MLVMHHMGYKRVFSFISGKSCLSQRHIPSMTAVINFGGRDSENECVTATWDQLPQTFSFSKFHGSALHETRFIPTLLHAGAATGFSPPTEKKTRCGLQGNCDPAPPL